MAELDRLHRPKEQRERQAGKTTDMLVEALGQADFNVPSIIIVGSNRDHVMQMRQMFIRIAGELGYKCQLWQFEPCVVTVRATTYRFLAPPQVREHSYYNTCFYDHSLSWDNEWKMLPWEAD